MLVRRSSSRDWELCSCPYFMTFRTFHQKIPVLDYDMLRENSSQLQWEKWTFYSPRFHIQCWKVWILNCSLWMPTTGMKGKYNFLWRSPIPSRFSFKTPLKHLVNIRHFVVCIIYNIFSLLMCILAILMKCHPGV